MFSLLMSQNQDQDQDQDCSLFIMSPNKRKRVTNYNFVFFLIYELMLTLGKLNHLKTVFKQRCFSSYGSEIMRVNQSSLWWAVRKRFYCERYNRNIITVCRLRSDHSVIIGLSSWAQVTLITLSYNITHRKISVPAAETLLSNTSVKPLNNDFSLRFIFFFF